MRRYLSILGVMMLVMLMGVANIFAAAPTIQARYLAFSSVTGTGMTLSWVNGNGSNRIVVATAETTPDWAGVRTALGATSTAFTDVNGDFSASGIQTISGMATYKVVDVLSGSNRTTAVSNLASTTTYSFHVFEYNVAGGIAYYTDAGTTNPRSKSTLMPQVTGETIALTGNDYFRASWTAVSNLSYYEIDLDDNAVLDANTLLWEQVDIGTDNTIDFTELAPGQAYSFRVRAVNGNEEGAWSTSPTTTTAANTAPDMAGTVKVGGFTEDGGAVAVLNAVPNITDGNDADANYLDYINQVIVTITNAQAGDVLHAAASGNITVAGDGSAALTLSGETTAEEYEAFLAGVTFNNTTNNNPDNFGANPTRTITLEARDYHNAVDASPLSLTFAVTDVNDAPTLTSAGNVGGPFLESAATPVVVCSDFAAGDVDDQNLASATITITDPQVGDVLACGTPGTITVSYTYPTLTLSGSKPLAEYEAALQSVTYSSSSENPTLCGANADRVITFVVNDGVASSTPAISKTIAITPENDAPVWADVNKGSFAAINEDDNASTGTLVSALIGTAITDADSCDSKGIAVYAETSPSGAWEYTLDGTSWHDLTGVAIGTAVQIASDADNAIRFVPTGDLNDAAGTANYINVVAWDKTTTVDGATVDVTTRGNNTEYSSAQSGNIGIVITPVNDAPVLANANLKPFTAINEDNFASAGNLVTDLLDATGTDPVTDVDAGALEGIAVYGETSPNGTWQYNLGAGWVNFPVCATTTALLLNADGDTKIRFVPDENYNGANTDNYINFVAWDRTGAPVEGATADITATGTTTAYSSANSGNWGITVNAVNDAPVLTSGTVANFANIAEDVLSGANPGSLVSALLNSSTTDVDGAGALTGIAIYNAQTANGRFELSIDAGTIWLAIPNDGTITATNALLLRSEDKVRFVPNANYYGTGNKIQFYAWDQTGGTFGAEGTTVDASSRGLTTPYSTTTAQSSIIVTSVDDAPVFAGYNGDAVSYTENGTPVCLDNGGDMSISDLEENYLNGRIVATITANNTSDDRLSVTTSGNISVAVNGSVNEISYLSVGVIGTYPVSGAGSGIGTDNLTITLTNLATNSILSEMMQQRLSYSSTSNYFANTTRTVTISASTDSPAFAVNSTDQILTVNLTNVNDVPVLAAIEGTALSYTENAAAAAITSTITVADFDDTNIESATVAITGNYQNGQDVLAFADANGITGTWTVGTGVLALSGTSSLANYQAALRSVAYFNSSEDPSSLARTVTFTVNDGDGNSNTQTRNITVTPVNDAPVLASVDGIPTFTENGSAVAVDANMTLIDVDDVNIDAASVVISDYFAGDVLTFTDNPGVITGSYTAGTLTVTFPGGPAAKANVLAFLRSVKYSSSSEDPTDLFNGNNKNTRNINFIVNDGDAASNTLSETVNITAVNDAPVLASVDAQPTYTENSAAVAVDANMTLTDIDNVNVTSATVVITDYFAGDVLTFADNTGVITGVYNAGTLTISFPGGPATKANVLAFLRSVKYSSSSEDPTDLSNAHNYNTRTVRFAVNDGTDPSNNLDEIVNITAVNDAPSITVADGAYTENAGATTVDAAASITNPEGDWNTGSLTVSITSPNATEDITILDDGAGVGNIDVVGANINDNVTTFATFTGGIDGANLVITFNANATNALVQKLVRHIQYSDATNNNPAASRNLAFTLVDAGALSGTDAANVITITAVNDAPVLAAIEGATLAYTENGAPVAITSTITTDDVDNTNLASATVVISANYMAEDMLTYVDANGITGVYAAGTLTLTGSATLANYQAALRSVTYHNTSDNPSTLVRTVSFTVNDGALASNIATRTITITAVNDAPVLAGAVNFTSITEDDVNPAGNTVASLIAGQITDPDGPATAIAVYAKTGSGTWEYTTTGGAPWTAVGIVSNTGALYLTNNANNLLRFIPTPSVNNAQTATLSFVAADNYSASMTNGQAGYNVSTGGGATDFSTATATASLSVTAVNDAPVWTDGNKGALASINEDYTTSAGTLVSTLIGTAVTDVDNSALKGIAITTIDNTNGAWQYTTDGTVWNAITPVSAASALLLTNDANRAIRFVPNADWNGTADISLVAWDRTSGTEGTKVNTAYSATGAFSTAAGTLTLTVTAVNDAPVLAAIEGTTLAYTENDAATAITSTITAADVDNANIASATVVISANYAAEDVLTFADANGITGSYAAGTLTLTGSSSTANYQTALRSVTYHNTSDNPSTLVRTVTFTINDGALASNTQTRTITVTAVNDAPTLTTISTLNGASEDAAFTITYADLLAAADEADVDGPAPTQFRIGTVTTGTLTKSSVAVTPGTTTLTTGESLVWTPVTNANGNLNAFTVVAYDGALASAAPVQVVVNTAAVNDAPVLTTVNTANFTNINEDDASPAGDLVSSILATGVSDVDAGALQGMAIYAANNANGQWQWWDGATWTNITSVSSSSALLVKADGGRKIRFVPNANYSGFTSITYYAWDQSAGNSEGTSVSVASRGGITPFSSQGTTAQLTVNPINDPPTFAAITDPTLCVNASAQTMNISGTTGVGESLQNQVISTLTAVSSNQTLIPNANITVTGLTTNQPNGTWTATVNYTPAAGQSGSAVITLTAIDDGGNVPLNNDTQVSTFTVTVNPLPVVTITAPAAVTYPTTVDLSAPAVVAGSANVISYEYYPTLVDAQNGTNVLGSPVISGFAGTGTYYIKGINNCSNDIKSVAVTINKKALTYTVAADNKVYDKTVNATGTITLTNVEAGDVVTASGTFAFVDALVANGKTVNVTGITLAGAQAANYSIPATAATTANITAKALTFTVATNNKEYDRTTNATGTITLTNVIAPDVVTASGTFAFATAAAANGKTVNVTGITLAGAQAANYTIAATSASTANITAKALTFTVAANNKPYDGNTNATGTITLTNVIAPDVVTASGTFAFVDATAANGKTVNVTGITLAGADMGNYTIASTSTTTANITPLAITVTANAGQTKEYGAADPASYTYTSAPALISGDVFTGSLVRAAGESVNNYAITQGSLAINSNYAITYVGANFAITKAMLTVTADDKSKTYGAANPALTVSYSGFKNSETFAVLTTAPTAATAATTNSPVGTYAIIPSGGAADNYNFTYVNGTLTVGKAVLTVSAVNANRAYGSANPAFTIGYSGFVGIDNASSLTTQPTAATTATALSPVGLYNIIPSGGVSSNYDFVYVNGTLTVNKAILTVTADAKTKTYGTADPVFTVTYTGYVNAETFGTSGVTGAPFVSRAAGETVGAYAIIPVAGTLAAANYSFTYVNGLLNINKANQTITFNALPAKTSADTDFAPGAASTSGLTVTYISSNTSVATIVAGMIHITGAGTTTITASQIGDVNYNAATTVDQLLTVTAVTAPVITGNPSNATICQDGTAVFSITSVTGTPVPTVKWQANTGSGWIDLANVAPYSGVNTNTLTITGVIPGMNGYQYKLVATNTQGNGESTPAVLTVTTKSTPTMTIAQTVGTNPTCAAPVTFQATVANGGGSTATYQWKVNGSNAGTNNALFTFTPTSGDIVTCEAVLTGGCINTNSITSTNSITMTVNPVTAISSHPANASVMAGVTANFTVVATGANLTYQWRKGSTPLTNGGNITGANSATLAIANVVAGDAGNYDVVVTGSCGQLTSNAGTLSVTVPPTKLAITTVGNQSSGTPFNITVESRDGSNALQPVLANTSVTVTLSTGTGTVSGSGTITLGTSSTVISVTYTNTNGQIGAVLQATATGLTSANSNAFNLMAAEPTIQASGIGWPSPAKFSMGINWTSGNGSERIVVVKQASSFSLPGDVVEDGASYPTANPDFALAPVVKSGSLAKVVFSGTGTSVLVNNLSRNTRYIFKVYEFNGTGNVTNYLTSNETDNPNSRLTLLKDGVEDVIAGEYIIDGLSINPKPVTSTMNIDLNLAVEAPVTITLYTIDGQEILRPYNLKSMNAGNNRLEIPVSQLSSGSYIVVVNAGNEFVRDQIIIVK